MPPQLGAELSLGGQKKVLRYTAPALAKVQRELDGQVLAETLFYISRASIHHVAVMVWGGRLHEDPDLEIDEVLEQLEPPIDAAAQAIVEALAPWIQVGKRKRKPRKKKPTT